MSNDGFTMQADKTLEADIAKASTPEEIRALLENAVERSSLGITRDPQTGQFVRRNPLALAEQTLPAEKAEQHTFSKTETIGGKEIVFEASSELELEKQISSAYKTAAELRAAQPPTTPTVRRTKTQAELEQDAYDKAELDLQFRRGELTTAEYLERTNAVGEYLESKGFDVDAAAGKQFEQSWQQATESFLRDTPEGRTWRGGQKNLELAGNLIQSHGLTDAADKVGALVAIAREMREKGLEFDSDVSPEQLIALTDGANPQEILEAWREQNADPEAANQSFIETFRSGRSSSLFGK